jgi:nitrogen fixation NifU-like protein
VDLYAENILDHYRHPRGKNPLASATVEHAEINLSCGDELGIQLTIQDGIITECGWSGTGCAISQAGMSLLFEEVIGMSIADAGNLTQETMRNLLGVPIGARRFKCAFLALHTLKNALRKFRGEEPQGWSETASHLPA